MIVKLLRISCKFEKITKPTHKKKNWKNKETGEMREKWSCYFWASDCFAEFYTRTHRLARGTDGEIRIHTHTYTWHKSILFVPFVPRRRSRAIKELTRKPPHVFRNHNSTLSNPVLSPSPPWSSSIAIPERDILELKDILWTSNPREKKNSGSRRVR